MHPSGAAPAQPLSPRQGPQLRTILMRRTVAVYYPPAPPPTQRLFPRTFQRQNYGHRTTSSTSMTLPSQDRSYRAARCHLRWCTPRCAPSSAPSFGSALALWFDTFVLALQSARSPRTHGELLSPTDPAPGRTHGRGASPCAELRLSFVCPTLDTLRMSSTPSLLCVMCYV